MPRHRKPHLMEGSGMFWGGSVGSVVALLRRFWERFCSVSGVVLTVRLEDQEQERGRTVIAK